MAPKRDFRSTPKTGHRRPCASATVKFPRCSGGHGTLIVLEPCRRDEGPTPRVDAGLAGLGHAADHVAEKAARSGRQIDRGRRCRSAFGRVLLSSVWSRRFLSRPADCSEHGPCARGRRKAGRSGHHGFENRNCSLAPQHDHPCIFSGSRNAVGCRHCLVGGSCRWKASRRRAAAGLDGVRQYPATEWGRFLILRPRQCLNYC
jgi:hypothetical protein